MANRASPKVVEELLAAMFLEHQQRILALQVEEQEHKTAAAKAKRERQELITQATRKAAEREGSGS